MNCVGCNREGIETLWGCICNECGGVMVAGGDGPRLIFRHVASVDGEGGRFQVVFDASAADYAVAYPRKAPMVVRCVHCGCETPTDLAGARAAAEIGMLKQPAHYVTHGTLDAVLAVIQPIARGSNGQGPPELSRSPHATEEERALLGIDR
jgi:hypothetical protein